MKAPKFKPGPFLALLDELQDDPRPEGYPVLDRFADFRKTFLETEHGKRVLFQILAWGRLFNSTMSRQPNLAFFREGERNVARRVLQATYIEPDPNEKEPAEETEREEFEHE